MTYYLKVLANLLFTLVAYVLAPVVALFCKGDGYLPDWLCWFLGCRGP
jgi:hypothetical protein